MINPLGNEVATVWDALKNGRSGVGFISIFDASQYPTKIAAEIRNWDISDCGEDGAVWKKRGRHAKFAAGAASQAVADSGILDSISDRSRIGVYFGAGEGNQDFFNFTQMVAEATAGGNGFDLDAFMRKGLSILDPELELEQEPSMPAAHLGGMFDVQGPNINCLTACAASSQAVGEATELIRRGDVDAMIAGGAHSMIHPFGLTGFNLLTALSTNNVDRRKLRGPLIDCVMGLCWEKVHPSSFWKSLSMRSAVARRSTEKCLDMAAPLTLIASLTFIPKGAVQSVA